MCTLMRTTNHEQIAIFDWHRLISWIDNIFKTRTSRVVQTSNTWHNRKPLVIAIDLELPKISFYQSDTILVCKLPSFILQKLHTTEKKEPQYTLKKNWRSQDGQNKKLIIKVGHFYFKIINNMDQIFQFKYII